MNDFLTIERDGAVLTVTMNRPDDRNAITDPEQSAEFVALAESLARFLRATYPEYAAATGPFPAAGENTTLPVGLMAGGGYGRLLLMPGAKAPVAVVARGKQVCTCFNVSEDDIGAQLQTSRGSDDQRLAALQSGLKCGTNCGSCIPELRRLVRAHPATGHVLQVA